MAIDNDEHTTESDKISIASNFITHAPPGEFNEVFNDVRLLLNDDNVLKEGCAKAFAQYNKEQFTPVKLEGCEKPTLVTPFNDLGNGRFYDPRSAKSFRFDHLRREASDVQPVAGHAAHGDSTGKAEPLRVALQAALDVYAQNHFKLGTVAVFGSTESGGNVILHACIEAHQFQPKNFHNGRWRSQWTINWHGDKVDVKGLIRVQVHYYEDGNVQLVTSKEAERKINYLANEVALAKEIAKIISDEESAYHTAVTENYATMSETTFKALRRQLPVTRAKIEWGKILNYKIGAELKPQ